MKNDEFLACLSECVGERHVLTRSDDMAPFLTDWRGRYTGSAHAVVRPADTAQVSAVVRLCHERGVGVVPQGGNTGLCGGATPRPGENVIVLSLNRLNGIRRIDPVDNTLVAEAGCTLAQIQQAAAGVDRLFPMSLASEGSCQIGGNIATNAGGVHVVRYGNMRQQVLGLEVVLPDGTVWNGLRTLLKDNTGYDLKQLFIGAEGTLGVITAAALRLASRPRQRVVAWFAVTDPVAALSLLAAARERLGERVSAFELIGRNALDVVLKHIPGARAPLEGGADWSVLLEVADVAQETPLDTVLESVAAAAFEAGWVVDAVIAASLAQCEALWALRENISEAQRIEGVSIKHDVSLPVSAIPAFLAAAEKTLTDAFPWVRIVAFGHMGDGNLHYNISAADAASNAALVAQTEVVNRCVHDLVASYDGSISAEHGIGQLKREEIVRYKSGVELDLMRAIKHALDPRDVMNPGKVLPEA
ncbi:FAD-binding oxidoreductase [Denitromonas iodatirespirans]|uniref:FAD-binding oxidoreductase n=1 Tax=Denitromonas iodatirespirans TaxID=2795389 RepID=A0A944DG05_DENI1|nr:FAD-binding oxidoreductase [Denitromonas iodatirespirans]MBT0963658.1 FAD-binding oxidoreductase [Denitromonas iodatirespirans]